MKCPECNWDVSRLVARKGQRVQAAVCTDCGTVMEIPAPVEVEPAEEMRRSRGGRPAGPHVETCTCASCRGSGLPAMVQVHVLLSAEQRAWVVDQAQARAIGLARYIRVLMEEAGGPIADLDRKPQVP